MRVCLCGGVTAYAFEGKLVEELFPSSEGIVDVYAGRDWLVKWDI